MIADEVRLYMQAASIWLSKGDLHNAVRALNHINHIMDIREAE